MFHKKSLSVVAVLIVGYIVWACIASSCTPVSASDGESKKPREVVEAEYRAEGTIFNRIYHFEYNGHKYIQFVNGFYDPTGVGVKCDHKVAGVVHDPDCSCGRASYSNDNFSIDF